MTYTEVTVPVEQQALTTRLSAAPPKWAPLTRMALLAGTTAFAAWNSPAAAQVPQIQHIIIVTQENRSTDSLFHNLPATVPGADIASSGLTSTGQTVPLVPISLAATYDMSHAYVQFRTQYDNGRMDGSDKVTCVPGPGATCPQYPAYAYVEQSQAQPLLDIATNYGFANRMFQTNRGPSLPAHLELLSGGGEQIANGNIFDANINNNHSLKSGCTSPSNFTLQLIGPSGAVVENVFPCFEHLTLPDVLQAPTTQVAPVSWRYYTNSFNGILDAPNAIRHICQPKTVNKKDECTGPWFTDGHIVASPPQLLTDIMSGNLQSVTWVNPTTLASDHPLVCNDTGPSWVAAIIDTIGQSAYWNNTAILVTWDDWGGFYDHVAPPNDPLHGYYEYGFRVPLLVISPYTPAGYVSNVVHDFGSILNFVETVFNVGLIPPGTFGDAKSDNLLDFFNFNMTPRNFTYISAPYPPSYFLNQAAERRAHPHVEADDPD